MTESNKPFSYKDAGVDIGKAAELARQIGKLAAQIKSSKRGGEVNELGGFAALYELPPNLKQPVLATATDGVGTKLALAQTEEDYHCLGIDLVAMCVNDLLCCGAEPYLFLDYYATGVLDKQQAAAVIAGICAGCSQADCLLVGGETAEMPGLYPPGKFDLAGFAVGIAEKAALLNPQRLLEYHSAGEELAVVGLRAAGFHANGFSLLRSLLSQGRLAKGIAAKSFMQPTRIYVELVRRLRAGVEILGLAHITGGGLTDNLPRVLPAGLVAQLDKQQLAGWAALGDSELAGLYQQVQMAAGISWEEMLRTFNCGVGMVVIYRRRQEAKLLAVLSAAGEEFVPLGVVASAAAASAPPAVVWV